MELLELKATIRKKDGLKPKAIRRAGEIPAVIYGPDTQSHSLTVNVKDLENVIKKTKTRQVFVNIVCDDPEVGTKPALMKELQIDPSSQNFLHADFYQIGMDRPIRTKVMVAATGASQGVKAGGILQVIRRELEIVCAPAVVPETIDIDVTNLKIGKSIHVADIVPPEGVQIPYDVNFTVITVVAPKGMSLGDEESEEDSEE